MLLYLVVLPFHISDKCRGRCICYLFTFQTNVEVVGFLLLQILANLEKLNSGFIQQLILELVQPLGHLLVFGVLEINLTIPLNFWRKNYAYYGLFINYFTKVRFV